MSFLPANPTDPLYLCGPLASGKSALAISLCLELDGEVVNADPFQAYQGLSLLSGAPAEEARAKVPHHLYGVLDPSEDCGPQAFRELVLPVIADIQARGKKPIILGGSGVYLKYLTHGPSSIPERDEALRAQLEERDNASLFSELKVLDPEGAAITDPQNRRYLMRALEICLLSGQKMSTIKAAELQKSQEITAALTGLYLLWENDHSKQRISSRTMQILEKGGSEEVEALREEASSTCRKVIGFSEIEDHLDGKLSLKECHKGFHTSTRRSAKRQRSWVKKEGWLEDILCPFPFDAKVGSFRGV